MVDIQNIIGPKIRPRRSQLATDSNLGADFITPTEPPLLELVDWVRCVDDRPDPLLRVDRLSLNGGERVGLVGVSGSGKTTLLRALAALDGWDAPTIRYQGQSIAGQHVPEYRRRVALVAQQPVMIESTVRDNFVLAYEFSYDGSEYQDSTAMPWLTRLGKPASFLDQPSSTLSGGESQLVALIRVLLMRPRVLLLDEPTAALDAEAVERVEHVLLDWQAMKIDFDESASEETSRAWIWISHDQTQVRRVNNHWWRINDGLVTEASDGS